MNSSFVTGVVRIWNNDNWRVKSDCNWIIRNMNYKTKQFDVFVFYFDNPCNKKQVDVFLTNLTIHVRMCTFLFVYSSAPMINHVKGAYKRMLYPIIASNRGVYTHDSWCDVEERRASRLDSTRTDTTKALYSLHLYYLGTVS